MFKCQICQKEFDSILKLSGHKSHHSKRNGLDIIKTKQRIKDEKEKNILNYLKNPEFCKNCNCVISYEKFLIKSSEKRKISKLGKCYNFFCSSSCSAIFNNKKRKHTEKSKHKISKSLKCFYENKFNSIIVKPTIIELMCATCLNPFTTIKSKIRKNCSVKCHRLMLSLNRQKSLNVNGNFCTPREVFNYKSITIEVDSNLEKAGIIYLVDNLNAINIERFKNIISYNDGSSSKTYNPDFICFIKNETYLIEIKQPWTSNSDHIYNSSIPFKKKALHDFCSKNNYKYLWIDFNSAPELKSIYKNVLKNRLI